MLAAIVGFRSDAVYLGPLVVGVLVGPLDTVHWEQRSFVRMAYNAGNRGLAALAASAAFVGCRDALGSAPVSRCIVVAVAGAAFVVVDLVLSTVLLHLVGEPVHDAARHVVEVDALTLPVVWYGALVAVLLLGVGWWAVALALVPVAFVPELVIPRARRRACVRDLAALVAVVAVMAALALILPVPDAGTVVALTTIGVLAGAELVVGRRTILSPLVALLVVTATVVVGRDEVAFAAAWCAVTAVAVSWWCTGRAPPSRAARRRPGRFAAAARDGKPEDPGRERRGRRHRGDGGAGRRDRHCRWNGDTWVHGCCGRHRSSLPRSAGPGCGGRWGPGGAAVVIAGVATLAAVAWWGVPVWPSRRLAPATRDAGGRWLGALFAAVAVTTIANVGGRARRADTQHRDHRGVDRRRARCVAHRHGGHGRVPVAAGAAPRAVGPRDARLHRRAVRGPVVPRLLLDGSPAGPVAVVVLTLVLARGAADGRTRPRRHPPPRYGSRLVSPTVRLEPPAACQLDRVGLHRTPRRAARYAYALLIGALLVVGAAVVLDGRWPAPGRSCRWPSHWRGA